MKHILNGIEISPRNAENIGVVSTFTGDPDELSLNVDSLVLPREAKDIVLNHLQTQSVFIGIPYEVQMAGGIVLDYYVDLTEKPLFRGHEIEVKIKRRKGLDAFWDKARGTSFELMVKNGVQFDTKIMPYFVIKDNRDELLLSLAISSFVLGRELIEATNSFIQATNDVIVAFTPIVGVGATGPVVSANTPGVVEASLNLIIQAAYLAGILLLILSLADKMFKILFPRRRWLKGCFYYELMKKGCEYLGYTFASNLLEENKGWFILPVPLQDENESIWDNLFDDLNQSYTKGYPTASDTIGIFGNFIEECKKQFNAEIFISNGVVRLERRDFIANLAPDIILPALNRQDSRDFEYSYNTEEQWKRYYIKYQLDFTDLHSVEGNMIQIHDAEYSMENNIPVVSDDLVLIKGLNEVNINFCLGANKDKLNIIEILALIFFGAIDFATYIITFSLGGTNFVNIILDRNKALKISSQYFGITKSLFVEENGTKQIWDGTYTKVKFTNNYRSLCSAERLWNDYHYINAIDKNDFIIRENVPFRIRPNEFVTLLNTNFALIDGKVCELLKIEWIDEKSKANVTYKEPFDYADNKILIQRIDD